MPPPRKQVLEASIAATCGDRDQQYGPPTFNLHSSALLKSLCRDIHADGDARHISLAEWEAIDAVLAKIARILCGPVLVKDNYTDAAAYMAIAYECAVYAVQLEEEANIIPPGTIDEKMARRLYPNYEKKGGEADGNA